MNRNYLIVGLCIGLVVGLSVTVGVAWFFMRQQAARTAVADARAEEAVRQGRRGAVQAAEQAALAEARAREQADKFTANVQAAPSPDELDGTWRVVSIHNRRGEATNKAPVGMTFRFEGEKLAISHSNATAKPPGARFHIEPFAKPKEIDITETRSDGQEETVLGIYRLDKGQLFITLDRKNTTRRPNGFVTGVNSGIEVMTLERVR